MTDGDTLFAPQVVHLTVISPTEVDEEAKASTPQYVKISEIVPLTDGFIRANQKIYVLLSPEQMVEATAVEEGLLAYGLVEPVKNQNEQVVRLRRHLHDGIVTVRSF